MPRIYRLGGGPGNSFKKITVPVVSSDVLEISVNGKNLEIPYVRSGMENPTTLFIPGLSGSGIPLFRDNVLDLSRLGEGARIMAIDIPPVAGFNPSLELGTEILRQCVRATGARNIVALSAGGLLAVNFCSLYPGQVDKLVLISSAGLGKEIYGGLRLMSLPIIGNIVAGFRIRQTESSINRSLETLFHNPQKIPESLAKQILQQREEWGFGRWKQWYLRFLRQGVNWKGQKIIMLDQLAELSKEIPVLLVHGEYDSVISMRHMIKACVATNGKIKIQGIANCGHLPQIEEAGKFNEIVANFLFGH